MVFANSRYDLSTPVFDDWVERTMGTLVQFRREVHANPELSFREVVTTERLMNQLREAGMILLLAKAPAATSISEAVPSPWRCVPISMLCPLLSSTDPALCLHRAWCDARLRP